jgi:hypothetical protein
MLRERSRPTGLPAGKSQRPDHSPEHRDRVFEDRSRWRKRSGTIARAHHRSHFSPCPLRPAFPPPSSGRRPQGCRTPPGFPGPSTRRARRRPLGASRGRDADRAGRRRGEHAHGSMKARAAGFSSSWPRAVTSPRPKVASRVSKSRSPTPAEVERAALCTSRQWPGAPTVTS